jgi:hypothetical protein
MNCLKGFLVMTLVETTRRGRLGTPVCRFLMGPACMLLRALVGARLLCASDDLALLN